MTEPVVERDDIRVIKKALVRFNEQAWGIAIGLVLGLALFVTTNWLLLKGGETVGPHLALLGQLLPGYRVTFLGSLIGFVYFFVLGYAIGRTIGTIYNRLITPA